MTLPGQHCPTHFYSAFTSGRQFLGRLPENADVWLSMQELGEREDLQLGVASLLGAVKKAKIAYYDQHTSQYETLDFDEPMEIAFCWGNISRKEGIVFPHLHIVLADEEGKSFSGHLLEGTILFAGEFHVVELLGDAPNRNEVDASTGLNLWTFPKSESLR